MAGDYIQSLQAPPITQPTRRQMLWCLSTRAYPIYSLKPKPRRNPTRMPIPGTIILTTKDMEEHHGEGEEEEEAVGERPIEEGEGGGEGEEEEIPKNRNPLQKVSRRRLPQMQDTRRGRKTP